jgi:competence protein ComGC
MDALITTHRTTKTSKFGRWSLIDGLMILGIIAMLLAAVALPAFAKAGKPLLTGMEDLESSLKAQAAAYVLELRISQLQ